MIIHQDYPCTSCEHYSLDDRDDNHWICDFDHDTCSHIKGFYNSDWYEGWITTSKKLPNTDEYINNVRKYYLIQDEYGDMQVARYTKSGWIPIHSLEVIEDEIVAWRILPKEYIEPHKKDKSCATCLYCRDGICKDEACVGCYDDPNHSNYEERDI